MARLLLEKTDCKSNFEACANYLLLGINNSIVMPVSLVGMNLFGSVSRSNPYGH